jgi:hypothetical protein
MVNKIITEYNAQMAAAAAPAGTAIRLEPLRLIRDNQNTIKKIVIPKNLEALQPELKVLISLLSAVLMAKGVEPVASTEDFSEATFRQPAASAAWKAYLTGLIRGLQNFEGHDYIDMTGNTGHGYAYIVHSYFRSKDVPLKLFKGSPQTVQQALTNTAWALNLPNEYIYLNSLIRIVCAELGAPSSLNTYLKPLSALRAGGIVTKSLPWENQTIVTQTEIAWLKAKHLGIEANWIAFRDNYTHTAANPINLARLAQFDALYQTYTASARPLIEAIRIATNMRFEALNRGKTKRQLQDASKIRLATRIATLRWDIFLQAFSPLALVGRPFIVSDALADEVDRHNQQAITELKNQFDTVLHPHGATLVSLGEAWWLSDMVPKLT